MLFEYNIKIIYRLKLQNLKINALIRIIKYKLLILRTNDLNNNIRLFLYRII